MNNKTQYFVTDNDRYKQNPEYFDKYGTTWHIVSHVKKAVNGEAIDHYLEETHDEYKTTISLRQIKSWANDYVKSYPNLSKYEDRLVAIGNYRSQKKGRPSLVYSQALTDDIVQHFATKKTPIDDLKYQLSKKMYPKKDFDDLFNFSSISDSDKEILDFAKSTLRKHELDFKKDVEELFQENYNHLIKPQLEKSNKRLQLIKQLDDVVRNSETEDWEKVLAVQSIIDLHKHTIK